MKQLCSHFTDAVDVPISQKNKIKCHNATAFCPCFNLRDSDNVQLITSMMIFPRIAMTAQMVRKFFNLMKSEG